MVTTGLVVFEYLSVIYIYIYFTNTNMVIYNFTNTNGKLLFILFFIIIIRIAAVASGYRYCGVLVYIIVVYPAHYINILHFMLAMLAAHINITISATTNQYTDIYFFDDDMHIILLWHDEYATHICHSL